MLIATPNRPLLEVHPLKTFASFGKETAVKALITGGFFSIQYPENVVEKLPAEIASKMSASQVEFLDVMTGACVIQSVKELYDALPQQELDAILFHEEGHIVHGDLLRSSDPSITKVEGIVINLEMELRADAYAASKVGKKTMAKALLHVLENSAEFLATKGGAVPRDQEVYTKFISTALMESGVRARFNALQ